MRESTEFATLAAVTSVTLATLAGAFATFVGALGPGGGGEEGVDGGGVDGLALGLALSLGLTHCLDFVDPGGGGGGGEGDLTSPTMLFSDVALGKNQALHEVFLVLHG